MKNLFLYFLFYKKTFLLPLVGSLFAYFRMGYYGLPIFICASILFMIFLYRRYLDDPKREQLYFYFNQGISETKLYGFAFLLNSTIIILIMCAYEAIRIG